MELYQKEKECLRNFLSNPSIVRSAAISGNMGVGKSRTIHDVLDGMSTHWVIFRRDAYTAFSALREGIGLSVDTQYEEILRMLSLAYSTSDCIVYENFEYCDRDSLELIKRVLQFHRTNGYPAVSIMEWNGEKPLISKVDSDIEIHFNELNQAEMAQYLKTIVCAKNKSEQEYIMGRLYEVSAGNLLSLQLSINVLVQRGILFESPGEMYSYNGEKVQGSLFLLYVDLFKELNDRIQYALKMVSPFEDSIYLSLLDDAFSKCKILDASLDELSRYRSFILKKQPKDTERIITPDYIFAAKDARDAVIDAIDATSDSMFSLERITAQLYQHLETLHNVPRFYDNLSTEDKIALLQLLTKIRKHYLTVNHLPYYVELMEYYYRQSSYWSVVEHAKRFLAEHVLNAKQIHHVQPNFFRLLFKAQLAIGQYQEIIQYENTFSDWDIKLLMARAHYNMGNPFKALTLCQEIESMNDEPPHGEVFSLEAAIYDWLGNTRCSLANFKKALQYIGENRELKYSLSKKYSLYLDFDLPECQDRMKEAAEYFSTRSRRLYAEALHNLGTSRVLSFGDISELEQSEKLLLTICDTEIYYPRNSIAIYYALNLNFQRAIDIWSKIDLSDITVDFCKFAIQNNLFCAYIKAGDFEAANSLREEIGLQLKEKSARSDLGHLIRQYYLNCGLLSLAEGQDEAAARYLDQALEYSKYPSTMCYLIRHEIKRLQATAHITPIKRLHQAVKNANRGNPSKLEKFFAEHRMYFCIIMFWGDC